MFFLYTCVFLFITCIQSPSFGLFLCVLSLKGFDKMLIEGPCMKTVDWSFLAKEILLWVQRFVSSFVLSEFSKKHSFGVVF